MEHEDLTTLRRDNAGAAISDDWNLRVYVAPPLSRSLILPPLLLRNSLWKDLTLAIVIGLCAGFVIASIEMSQSLSPSASAIKVTPAAISAEEVARLKTRNRRLEAFVEILKNRPPAKAHGR